MYKQIISDFQNHCMKDYPLESCGLITLGYQYVPCKNISETPKESFVLDPFALIKYDRNIFAICHSHPGDSSPLPSKKDKIDPIFKDYKFVVGNSDKVYIYWLEGEELVVEEFNENHVN